MSFPLLFSNLLFIFPFNSRFSFPTSHSMKIRRNLAQAVWEAAQQSTLALFDGKTGREVLLHSFPTLSSSQLDLILKWKKSVSQFSHFFVLFMFLAPLIRAKRQQFELKAITIFYFFWIGNLNPHFWTLWTLFLQSNKTKTILVGCSVPIIFRPHFIFLFFVAKFYSSFLFLMPTLLFACSFWFPKWSFICTASYSDFSPVHNLADIGGLQWLTGALTKYMKVPSVSSYFPKDWKVWFFCFFSSSTSCCFSAFILYEFPSDLFGPNRIIFFPCCRPESLSRKLRLFFFLILSVSLIPLKVFPIHLLFSFFMLWFLTL